MRSMNVETGRNLTLMQLTAVIWSEPTGGYCVLNPETGVASQGETVEEALANIEEATALFLEECPFETPPGQVSTVVTSFHVRTVD